LSVLAGLWLASLLVSLIALAIMIGLIVARWVSRGREREREAERKRLVPLMLGAEPSRERILPDRPASELLTDLATEFIHMVRGEEKGNFVASAERIGVAKRLRRRLRRGSARVRLSAAEALAHFAHDEGSLNALRTALDDRDPDVRLAAALSLASAGLPPPARELVEKLGLGTREASALMIGLFEDIARHRPDEVRRLVEDPNSPPAVKVAAIEALSESGDYSLVPAIARLALAAPPGAPELPRYLKELGDFGHPAGADAVSALLDSPDGQARAAAAEAAGRIGMTEAAGRLGDLLGDEQWWVRFRAGEALARLGDMGRTVLLEIASSAPEPAGTAARLTLAERGLA